MNGIIRIIFISLLVVYSQFAMSAELAVESFSRLPEYQRPILSPDGKFVAFIENNQQNGLSLLGSISLETGEKHYLLKSDNEEVRIKWFKWANGKTLIVSSIFASTRNQVEVTETRLMAIEADGTSTGARPLIRPRSRATGKNNSQFQDNVIDFMPDDNDHIMVAVDLDKPLQPSVYKLNIYTKKKKRLERGKRQIRSYMTDQQSRVRVGKKLNYENGEAVIYVRQVDDRDWQSLFEYNALKDPAITALGFALDPNILYYNAYKDDRKALFKIDLRTRESELVFEDKEYDVDGRLIYSHKTRDVIGFYHSNTDTGKVYWDTKRERLQGGLDKVLPDTDNYLVDFSQNEELYILYMENDYSPGIYLLGDRKEGTLGGLFEQYPDIPENELSEHEFVTYTARDGTKIEGYLTLPKGAEGPVPTILHPHGGPGAREFDGFDYWTSFFSNRGYAVFRPNFRGSTGYGYEFAKSQMKGWGLTMQDDLTDATQWLIDEKISTPDKICIVGASYGGYAALMGAVKTPDLFACAVSFAGVSNLKKLVSRSRKYVGSKFVKNQFGNDSDDLKARSPYYHAEKITIPVLLVHGESDRVVDLEQSEMMAEELKDLDKEVEYLELENGNHYLSIQRNRHAFFAAMDTFLKTHLR